MAAIPNAAAALEELKKRGITVSTESVMDEEEGTTFDEFKKGAESLLKGSAKGIVDIVGGWGNLYDYLKKSKEPSKFSSAGIMKGIRDLGGPDLQQIQGYRGTYEFGQSAAPATALSAAGLPGLFARTPAGLVGEFGVAGTTGLAAQTIAPDSPVAQILLQSSPYAIKGGLTAARSSFNTPTGQIPADVNDLLRVGRMTPGQATGSRAQLATEARVAESTKIGEASNLFKQAQAQDVQGFLDNLFKRTTSEAVDTGTAAQQAISAFNNYGKALSSKLRSDAAKDFNAAKKAGGQVSTDPVVSAIQQELASIPPEVQALAPMRGALQRILDEYVTPAQEAKITPSTVLGPTGQPAFVSVQEAVPAQLSKISIDRLQKNLSAWGEAAYSGKADFGKGNIFEGVAPGQAKGIALKVLRGFRDSLDQAVESGVAGADDLAKARDKFKNNLSKIEDYSNYPLVKYFDVPTATALTPEDVISKLSKSKPSERVLLASVLKEHPEGSAIWDTVRRSQLEEVINKASKAASGAAEGAPEIDTKILLKELNNKKGDFNYLFTDEASRNEALLAIQWLKKTTKQATEGQKGVAGDAYAVTRGVGGTAQQGLILRELASLADVILRDPRATADVIFNPDTVKMMAEAQKKGKLTKAADLVKSLGEATAKFAPRVGPMAETTQATDTTEQPSEQPQVSPEEALQQLRSLGIEVE